MKSLLSRIAITSFAATVLTAASYGNVSGQVRDVGYPWINFGDIPFAEGCIDERVSASVIQRSCVTMVGNIIATRGANILGEDGKLIYFPFLLRVDEDENGILDRVYRVDFSNSQEINPLTGEPSSSYSAKKTQLKITEYSQHNNS